MEDKINKIWYKMNMKEITSEQARQQVLVLFAVSGQSEQLKCYHYDHEWKSDGQGGNLKYCNDCKCYV